MAPKIVGILGLSESADVTAVRNHLVKHCLIYQNSVLKSKASKKDKNADDDAMQEEEASSS